MQSGIFDWRRPARLALLAFGMFLLAACSPAMRPERVPGSFAWFDLVTDNPLAAQSFYSDMFGWSFANGPVENAQVISSSGQLIGGMIGVAGQSDSRAESQWKPVLSVEDTQTAISRAKSAGGRLLEQPVQTSGGVFAAIADTSGAELTLYDGSEGVPLGGIPVENSWVWVDLFTSGPTSARTFYAKLAGFETRSETDTTGTRFEVFSLNGRDRGGLVHVPRSQITPNWLPYVHVTDLDSALARANQLGARTLAREGDVAVIIDPTGAAIGLADREDGS